MVPNSLGPAELVHRYGTDEQKRRYLPRLAVGEEIPCFALTGFRGGQRCRGDSGRGQRLLGDLLDRAVRAGIITTDECQEVLSADEVRDEVIQVDAFLPETFRSLRG